MLRVGRYTVGLYKIRGYDLHCVSVLAQCRFPRFIKQYSHSFSWAEVALVMAGFG